MKNIELAVLFKKILHQNEEVEFIPVSVLEGYYSKEDNSFVDKDGTHYYHIIENPDSYGYCHRDSLESYKKDYRHLPLIIMKYLILREIKKYNYTYNIDSDTSSPVILFSLNNSNEVNILLDEDMKQFYKEKCPYFYNNFIEQKEDTKEETKQEKNINFEEIYKELTFIIIDQEEAIQKLLTILYKQKEGHKITNKNIILNGTAGVGKSLLAKKITELLNIPAVTISANNGKFPTADYILLELLKKTKLNVEAAQKGVIIIDKFEDLVNYISAEGEAELEKLLDKDIFYLSTSIGEYEFDTSNLVILGLSNLEKLNKANKHTIGFESKTYTDQSSYILEKFSSPIQMKKLDYDSFIKILIAQNGPLNSNIKYLCNKGVEVKVEKKAIEKIATMATKKNNGVKTLEEIIDRTLQVAEFEIVKNPELYSELIITAETAENNKAYTLVKKIK